MCGKFISRFNPGLIILSGFWIVLFLLCLSVSPLRAHKVYLFAWVEGGTVRTDSYLSNKKKIKDGIIQVFDPLGKKLLEGKTDTQGSFSFKIPKKTDLTITLTAAMGHRAEFTLPAEEISGPHEHLVHELSTEAARKVDQFNSQKSVAYIVSSLELMLDQKLQPIEMRLARLDERQGPGATEVIGGIGYLIGLMGLALYFKSRNKNNPT